MITVRPMQPNRMNRTDEIRLIKLSVITQTGIPVPVNGIENLNLNFYENKKIKHHLCFNGSYCNTI